MPIPHVVTKRCEGQRVRWQPATQTNRDPNHDKTLARSQPTEDNGNLSGSRRYIWARITVSTVIVWSAASISKYVLLIQAVQWRLSDVPPIQKSNAKVIQKVSSSRKITRRQVGRHFRGNGTDRCRNGSSKLTTPYREQTRSTRIVVYPRPAFSAQQSRQITLQSVLINKPKFFKAPHHAEIRNIEIPRSMVVEASSWWSRRASQHPAAQSPVHPWKIPTNRAHPPLLVGPRRKKTRRGQRPVFPSETSRFAPLVLAHRGSALLWLFDDRAALRPRRIWCVPTR